MTGLLLHLSSPLQLWGGAQGGRVRTSRPIPTRSGLMGMLAAALGRPRGADNSDLHQLGLTVRVDREGIDERDWHTVGGGYPRQKTVVTADGGRRNAALIFEDWYMADAAYTVAVTGPQETIRAVAGALARPVYPVHLGRRSCPPCSPVLIGAVADPLGELERMPLHRPAPRRTEQEQPVTFFYEEPPEDQAGLPPGHEVQDVPDAGGGRSWGSRPLWRTIKNLPGEQCAGQGTEWLTALTRYRDDTVTAA